MVAHTNCLKVSLCAVVALSIGAVAAFAVDPLPVFSIQALADTTASEDDPSMSARYVAYERSPVADDSDIVVVDLETGAEWLPTTNNSDQYQPDMTYSQVAYADSRNGHADIYIRSTGGFWDEYRVTDVAGNQMYPSAATP
ncbi:hypothetical protein EG835_11740 [bacterium]|nr:hypothetical protein [bacterium]